MIQGEHTVLENYRANMKFVQKTKPQEIEYIIIGHCHQDHIGMIPTLYAKGKCNAKIIVPKGSTAILKEMWLDSSFINCRDVEVLNIKDDRNYEPFYTEDIVYKTLDYVQEIESDNIVKLSDELAIRYTDAGHILLSKQCEVYINGGSHTRKILFSSDLGNIATQDTRVFVENFKPISSCNIAIMECTYSSKDRQCTKETYKKDIEKIKSVVEQYCVDNNNRVLIPSFSLDRTPYILWILYSLFGKDENFKVPILVDSPLANRLLDCYSSILEDDRKELFDEMMSWKNIRRVITPEDSKAAISDKEAKVILSSSGMLTAGRSVKWTQSILPHENDCILFMGYSGEDTLAWKIKHNKDNKTININGKPYKNNAQIYDLKSFSSHMQRIDMINYYKSINCEKIYLVHGDLNKIEFKHDLEEAIFDCLKSTKVVAVNNGTKISL
jgi:metallo-beta-lactamase family protein